MKFLNTLLVVRKIPNIQNDTLFRAIYGYMCVHKNLNLDKK